MSVITPPLTPSDNHIIGTSNRPRKTDAPLLRAVLCANATKALKKGFVDNLESAFAESLTLKPQVPKLSQLVQEFLKHSVPQVVAVRRIVDQVIQLHLKNCPTITLKADEPHLDLSKYPQLQESTIRAVVGVCKQATIRLDLSKTSVGDSLLQHMRLPALRKLFLANCPHIDDKALATLADRLKMLEKLVLDGCPQISDEGIRCALERLPAYTRITAANCPKVTPMVQKILQNSVPQAIAFKVDFTDTFTVKTLEILLRYHPRAKNLVLDNLKTVEEMQMVNEAFLLAKHAQLEMLFLDHFRADGPSILKLIRQSQNNLTRLFITGLLTRATLQTLTDSVHNLAAIVLTHEGKESISDHDVQVLSTYSKTLNDLCLSHFSDITIQCVTHFLQTCPNLKRLLIEKCPKVDPKEMVKLSGMYPNVAILIEP